MIEKDIQDIETGLQQSRISQFAILIRNEANRLYDTKINDIQKDFNSRLKIFEIEKSNLEKEITLLQSKKANLEKQVQIESKRLSDVTNTNLDSVRRENLRLKNELKLSPNKVYYLFRDGDGGRHSFHMIFADTAEQVEKYMDEEYDIGEIIRPRIVDLRLD